MYAIGQVPRNHRCEYRNDGGYRKRGILGGIIATLGEISPAS